jgi:hypothetical protein
MLKLIGLVFVVLGALLFYLIILELIDKVKEILHG